MNWESQCNWSARSSSHSWRINFIFLLFIFNCMPYHCGAFVFGKELWPADQALGAPNHKSLPTSFSFKASHSRWKRMIGHMKVCVFLPKSLCTVNTLYTFFFFFPLPLSLLSASDHGILASFAQGSSLDLVTNSAASWGFPFSSRRSCAHGLGT